MSNIAKKKARRKAYEKSRNLRHNEPSLQKKINKAWQKIEAERYKKYKNQIDFKKLPLSTRIIYKVLMFLKRIGVLKTDKK